MLAQVLVITLPSPGTNAAVKHAITYCMHLKCDSDVPPKLSDTHLKEYTAD